MWIIEWWNKYRSLRVFIKLENKEILDRKTGDLIEWLEWPVMVEQVKVWTEYVNYLVKWFEWMFNRIDTYSYKSEDWSTYEWITLVMDDGWEEWQLRMWWSSLARSLMNSLAGTEWLLWLINVSVYLNKKWYPSIWIKNNWKPTTWKFDQDDQKTMIKTIKHSKWNITDFGDYEEALKLLVPSINERKQNKDIMDTINEVEWWKLPLQEKSETKKKQAKQVEEEDEVLPF